MKLDVVATWNDTVLYAGRSSPPVSFSGVAFTTPSGELIVPEGFSRDGESSLVAGDLRVTITREKVRFKRWPRVGLLALVALGSLGLHAGVLEVSRRTPVDPVAEANEKQALRQRLLSAHVETPSEASDPESAAREEGTGTRAKAEEGSMGSPKERAVATLGHGHGRALEDATEFGMIGLIGSAPTAMWGSDVGDAFGAGGLGLSGTGAGGGGRGEGFGSQRQLSAGVRTGEWDDNLTLREFRRVLARSQGLPLEPLDVSVRRVLVARDSAGKPLASCPITVSDAQGNAITLRTASNGRALLFPRAERLSGELTAYLRCGGNSITQAFTAQTDDGVVRLDGREPRDAIDAPIDVAFALDTTGSMSEEIAAIQSTLAAVAARVSNVRVGLVEYKDRSDPYTTRVFPMSSDVRRFSRTVAALSASGGGDMPEAVNLGLHEALSSLEWNEGAPARLLFVVGDAPPHAHDPGPSYADEARAASHAGVQVFTIAASGMDEFGQIVFRQLAQYTGGTEMFVLRGGAGPESTGGGDPVQSCGGTQKKFTSGNLDALIVAKIEAARSALDADPLAVRGVGQDVVSSCGG